MEIGSILLILAVILLVAIFVSRPFFETQAVAKSISQPVDEQEHVRSSLLAEYDRLLNALQELEFDNTLGKIPAEDFPAQRAALLTEASVTLQKLDDIQPAGVAETVEDRIEAAIATRSLAGRARQTAAVGFAAGDCDLEAIIARRAAERREASAGFCPRCGKPVQKSDAFCPKCGAVVKS
jgi:predicted RNA-binding Zn-ribbon protein involved in translation (DUF1610 family)